MNFFLILPNQVNKLFEISSVKVKFLLSALRSLLSALLSKARVRAFPVLKSSSVMRFVPLGRVICFILCILCISNLCSSLSDSFGLRCGSSTIVCVRHSSSNSVIWSWKFSFVLLR